MHSATQKRLSSAALMAARDRHFSRLEALYAGEMLERVFVLCGITGRADADPYTDPDRWLDACLDDLAEQADRALDAVAFRPLVVEFGPYGVHFVDKLLGAELIPKDGNWWTRLLDAPVGSLAYPDIERDETWRLCKHVALAFAARGVTAPLFGLPTLSSPLNIAVNLYGDAFLTALLTSPDAAQRDLVTINRLIGAMHRWYIGHVPREQLQPVVAAGRTQLPGFGQLCACTTQLLSAGQYAQFVAPLDATLLSVYPGGGMIHVCGEHRQHIPTWRAMPSVRALQFNDLPNEHLEDYFAGLRNDQVIYMHPTANMTVERAIAITGGRRLVVTADLTEPVCC
ncbi:MAG: hypothetical protein QG656_97 [Candidatus Hydrogenedentes bacterium]|nr:hypothetical protein [Candidatus Hydrogenedentota bacterium]